MTAGTVSREQRHTRSRRCPICDGADGDPRGKGKRCSGFVSSDGLYVHCSREEHAGAIDRNDAGLYAHRMQGPCKCGLTHGEAVSGVLPRDAFEATYDYVDERGALLFQVVRKPGKRFLQRCPDGAGGWIWRLGEARRVLYRLRDLLEDDADRTVHIVEGEKDVETLTTKGYLATCNPMGAGKWSAVADHARDVLRDRDVVIVADRDDVGRRHALEVADSLRGVARSLVTMTPPAPFKDATDMVQAGRVLTELEPLDVATPETAGDIAARVRVWTPAEIWAPIEPPVYAVGTLAVGDVGMVCAHGASFKSWLATDAVVAKASGAKWLQRFPCEGASALYLDNEMGPDECRRRIQRDARARGHKAPIEGIGLVSMPGFSLATVEGIEALRFLATGRSLIVVDSLAAFCPEVDENDARFADALKRAKQIADDARCAFLFLHHSRKAREGEDKREKPRGTSALFAACDVVLQLSRCGDGFLVEQTKARKGKAMDPFVVRVEDIDGEEATRVYATDVDEPEDAEVAASVGALERAKRKIVELLARDHDVRSASEVHRRIRGTKKTNLDAIRELEERKLIVVHEGTYRLSSEVNR